MTEGAEVRREEPTVKGMPSFSEWTSSAVCWCSVERSVSRKCKLNGPHTPSRTPAGLHNWWWLCNYSGELRQNTGGSSRRGGQTLGEIHGQHDSCILICCAQPIMGYRYWFTDKCIQSDCFWMHQRHAVLLLEYYFLPSPQQIFLPLYLLKMIAAKGRVRESRFFPLKYQAV